MGDDSDALTSEKIVKALDGFTIQFLASLRNVPKNLRKIALSDRSYNEKLKLQRFSILTCDLMYFTEFGHEVVESAYDFLLGD